MIWMDVDTALAEVPVNAAPLTDDGDFKSIETGVAYNAGGMSLTWHFVTTGGAYTATAVTPTTGGTYDWAHQAQGMFTIAMPASGGASINNDTKGFGWFTGVCTGVLPWRGPTIGFRAAGKNDLLVDGAHSATRGLAGTALPDAAADAAGGLPISDAGGLDMDAILADTAVIGTPAGASIAADIAAVKTQTAAIEADTQDLQTQVGTDGAGLTNLPWNASWDAEVQSEVTDALNAYDPPTKAELDSAVANVSVDEIQATALADLFNTDSGTTYASAVAGSVVKEIADNAGGSSLTVADIADAVWEEALADHEGTAGSTAEALADAGGSGASAADIADAVMDEALSGHTTAGTLGKAVADILTDTAEIGAAGAGLSAIPWNSAWDAEVQSEAADALNAYDPPTKAELDSAVSGLSTHSASDVWAVATRRLSSAGIDDILDEVIEGSYTLRHYLRGFAAAMMGKASGLETTEATYRDTGDSKDRIVATVDADGNRTAVTLDLT